MRFNFNKKKFEFERTKMTKNLVLNFPNIGEDYEIVAPGNSTVNCIAYALGANGRVNPQTNTLPNDPLSLMDAIFKQWGYNRTTENPKQIINKTGKVVLYAHTGQSNKVLEVTHAVRQHYDGSWLSKMGDKAIIRVASLDVLSGREYGQPVAVYDK